MGKSKKAPHLSNDTKNIHKLFQKLNYRHSHWETFTDFVAMGAYAISNTVDLFHYDKREAEYMEIVKKYSAEELLIFSEIFAELALSAERCVQEGHIKDILGNLFHELELHNKYRGQYFTPQNVCDMMGSMMFSGSDADDKIREKGYISVCEPACGSGAMVLGAVNALLAGKQNYSSQLLVDATDVDIKCVHMSYIQFSLYGIPATIRHGNSLTMEEWSVWTTPAYVLGEWLRRAG